MRVILVYSKLGQFVLKIKNLNYQDLLVNESPILISTEQSTELTTKLLFQLPIDQPLEDYKI